MEKLTSYMVNIIQYGSETRKDEFKPPMGWFKTNRTKKFGLVRTALAMTNTPGGGLIYIGISQRRDRRKGVVSERRGVNDKQYRSFNNPDDIGRFFRGKSNHSIEFALYGGSVTLKGRDKKFVVMQIFESKSYIPVICTWSNPSSKQHCRLAKDAIYIRSIVEPIESKRISSQEEWEEMIRRLLTHKEVFLHRDLVAACRQIQSLERIKSKKKKITQRTKQQYDKERKARK